MNTIVSIVICLLSNKLIIFSNSKIISSVQKYMNFPKTLKKASEIMIKFKNFK